jgi:hypothetical protein
MSTYVPAALRRLVALCANGICEYCLIAEDDTYVGCQVEHIISEKHRGQTIESNLAFACIYCNRYKGTDIATLSPVTHNLCRLFNPRTDRWSEHFRLDGIQILGLSEIGQATAFLLGFNSADRLLERDELKTLNRYPSPVACRVMERHLD